MFLGTFLKSKKTLSFKELKKQSINNDKAQKNKDTCIIKMSYFISFVLLFIFGVNFLTTHTHTHVESLRKVPVIMDIVK